MGLFDILADFADIGKDIIMLPVEIGKAAVECATDINETIAQDVKNKVNGSPDKTIRTSFDIRNEADQIINSVNESFYKAKDRLRSSWNKTSKNAETVAKKREQVYQQLGLTISSTLVKLPAQPVELIFPSDTPYVSASFDVGTFFGVFGTAARMEAAEEYLQQAKEYRADVRSLINDIDSLRRTVLNIADAQTEELEILNMIQAAYRMKSNEILTKSAKLLQEISVLCVQEIGANTDKKYNDLLRDLKSMWY
jgi:hypothetical protein